MHLKAKVLDIIDDDITGKHKAIEGKVKVSLDTSTMRRLHRANLPIENSQKATEILMKVTAIDKARQIAEAVSNFQACPTGGSL